MVENLYELTIDDTGSDEDGIFAMSLVSEPATEVKWVYFNKEEESNLVNFNSEKRIITGPALIPNQKIYRREGDYEYYVYASKETIEKSIKKFSKDGLHKNITLEHDVDFNNQGVYIFESWIAGKDDKSKEFGLDVPEGTWMISASVENDKIWNLIKEKGFNGFSIEAMFTFNKKEENMSTKKETNFNKFLQKLETFLNEFKEVKLEVQTLQDGSEIFIDEENNYVYSLDEDGEPTEEVIKDAELTLEDGTTIFTDSEGVIQESKSEDGEDADSDTPAASSNEDEAPSEESETEVLVLNDGTEVMVDSKMNATIDGEPAPDGEHQLDNGGMIVVSEGVVVEKVTPEEMKIQELSKQVEKLKSKLSKKEGEVQKLNEKYTELSKKASDTKIDTKEVQNDVPIWKQIADKHKQLNS